MPQPPPPHAFPVWHAVFWVTYSAWILMELWILFRDRRAASGDADDRGSRLTIGAAIILGLVAAFWSVKHVPGAHISLPTAPRMAIALVLMWCGMALRLWAVRTLGRLFRTSVMVLDDHSLIDTGPYRRLRNPSYTGSILTLAGIGVGLGNWAGLAALVVFGVAGYARRIAVEDAALRRRFTDTYETYRKGRWALIPPVW